MSASNGKAEFFHKKPVTSITGYIFTLLFYSFTLSMVLLNQTIAAYENAAKTAVAAITISAAFMYFAFLPPVDIYPLTAALISSRSPSVRRQLFIF